MRLRPSVELDAAATVSGLELTGATLTTDGSESLTVTGELDLGDGADLGGDGNSDCTSLGAAATGGAVTNTSEAMSTQATTDNLTSDTAVRSTAPER